MKVLFFAPHSAIWVHAFPEALVAESLQQLGHEIVYVTCGRELSEFCVAMSAFGLDHGSIGVDKAAVCTKCEAARDLLRGSFALRGADLATELSASDRSKVDTVVASIDQTNFLNFTLEGVQVGRLALYEFLLQHKKSQLTFSDSEWAQYKGQLRNVLRALLAATRIFDREKPQRVLVYNALYSVNNVVCKLAAQRGIPQYFLHAGGNLSNRLQTLMLGRGNTFEYLHALMSAWPTYRNRACPAAQMKAITDHFLTLLQGQSVFGYSAAAEDRSEDIRTRYGIKDGQRILVATMSSYDERFAAETIGAVDAESNPLFPLQIDWIRAIVKFAAGRADVFLIVRVHPREFPNKRERVRSEHVRALADALIDLPVNVRVNWPSDNLSLYKLACEADVFLNAWSSVGKEMPLLGLPVVTYCPNLLLFPSDLNYVGTTMHEYFAQIDRALQEGWSAERARLAYRWMAIEYGYGLLTIEDAYRQKEYTRPSGMPVRALRKIARAVSPFYAEKRDCARRPRRLAAAGQIDAIVGKKWRSPLDGASNGVADAMDALSEETRELQTQLSRLVASLSFGKSAPAPLLEKIRNFVDLGATSNFTVTKVI
jgi:hypothetical protein